MFSSIVGKGGMEQRFENKELNASVRTVRRGEEVLFYAKDVAESQRYAGPKKAIRKKTGQRLESFIRGTNRPPFPGVILTRFYCMNQVCTNKYAVQDFQSQRPFRIGYSGIYYHLSAKRVHMSYQNLSPSMVNN